MVIYQLDGSLFVHHLPHQLIEAFRSTLEETRGADLLLHVIDAAGALELRPDGSAILTDTSCYSEKTGLAMDVETGIGLYF